VANRAYRLRARGPCPRLGMTAPVAFHEPVMSAVSMTASAEQAGVAPAATESRAGARLAPALGLLLPVALAVCWEIAVRMGWSNGRSVPPPSVIWQTFVDLAATGELQRHALATLSRVAARLRVRRGGGTVFGAITGYSALTHRIVDPTLQACARFRRSPGLPLFILWFGIFEASKVILIAVGVFFPGLFGVMGAVMVGRSQDRRGRTRLSAFGPAMVRRILLPAVMPTYVISLRAGLGLGWMFVVAAEFSAPRRSRFSPDRRQQLGKPAQIVAAIVAFAILGKTTDWLIAAIARRSCAGKTGSRAT